jgi:hypothetical protein
VRLCGGIARKGAEAQKTNDFKMQKRSHHVLENKGSALGSFSKRTHFFG